MKWDGLLPSRCREPRRASAMWFETTWLRTSHCMVPLRVYIEFILQRSQATYATLLVTFYYLALLRSAISRQKAITDQLEDLERAKPLQCQRRMFLAALILAWKYTQDRNYSLGAWAKISGLCSKEIKSNEAVFLSTVDWRLHIPHTVFER
jgi:PHO85 cyclin-5